jgi:hypothetical protein
MLPSLGEFTRRLLRNEGVVLLVPPIFAERCEDLPRVVAEYIPSRLHLPEIEVHDESHVVMKSDGEEIGRLSGSEPNLGSVWVIGQISELIDEMLELSSAFLAAGYPGCRDCLGPAASEPWDEEDHRKNTARGN